MKRLLAMALLLTACASTAPAQPISLEPCDWTAATNEGFLPSFTCLDGGATPQGLPAPAIVNVWGSWCPPCREEIPYFEKLDRNFDVTIVGVDVDEPGRVTGQRFASRVGMTWPNLYDGAGASTSVFGPGVPVTWFIDSNGEVAYKKIGVWKSYDELETAAKKFGVLR